MIVCQYCMPSPLQRGLVKHSTIHRHLYNKWTEDNYVIYTNHALSSDMVIWHVIIPNINAGCARCIFNVVVYSLIYSVILCYTSCTCIVILCCICCIFMGYCVIFSDSPRWAMGHWLIIFRRGPLTFLNDGFLNNLKVQNL